MEAFTSANQKVHTCSFLPTQATTYKNKCPCLHIKNCHEPTQAQRKFFKRKHILLRNTNGWTFQKQANSPTAHATFAVGAELHCPPADAQHVRFLLPQPVGKPEQSVFPCYMAPMKGDASWGLQLQAEQHAVREEVTTAIRKK